MFATRTTSTGIDAINENEEPWRWTTTSTTPQSQSQAQSAASYAIAVATTATDASVLGTAITTADVAAVAEAADVAESGGGEGEAAATATTATNTSRSSRSLHANNHSSPAAEAPEEAMPLDSKTATAAFTEKKRTRIRVALSVLTLAVVFGAGFGLGVLYSKNQCLCDRIVSSSSRSRSRSPSLENSGASSCNEANNQGNPSGSDASGSTDDTSQQTPVQQPQAEDPSILPPIFSAPATKCSANDDALDELRQAVRVYANAFINEFAYYIRKGGNNTLFADTEGSHNVDGVGSDHGEPWNALDWAMAVTAGTGTETEDVTETTVAATSRGSVPRQTRASAAAAAATSRVRRSNHQRSLQATRSATAPQKTATPPDDNTSEFIQRRAQSVGNATTTTVQVADTVQNHGAYVYVAHGDEIVVIQSATTAIHSRIRIPKVHSETKIAGLLLLLVPDEDEKNDYEGDNTVLVVPHLVALVDEWAPSSTGYEWTSSINTTVLVYQHGFRRGMGADAQQGINIGLHTQALTLVQRYSLPGVYSRAHAVHNKVVHVVTGVDLMWYELTDNLTPAVLQANNTKGADSVDDLIIDESPLRLNETQYRQLAHAQLERHIEAFVLEKATAWDCTAFVPLLPIRPNNTNGDLSGTTQLVYTTSLDVSAIPISVSSMNTMSTINVVTPGRRYHDNMLVTDDNLVLWYQLWSGSNISLASQPLTWLIVFTLVNASVVLDKDASSSSAVVPGALVEYTNNPVDVNHYTTQSLSGQDCVRFMTTRYNNLVDFYERGDGNDYTQAARSAVVTLGLTDTSTTNSDNGTAAAQTLSMVVGELTDMVGINGTITSITYHGDYMLVVVSPVRDEMTGALVNSNDASLIIYTIDTSDPSNPVIGGGGQELVLPVGVDALYLYPIGVNWMIGIGASYSSNILERPIQLLLLNVSNLDEQPPRLVHQWQHDTETFSSNSSNFNENDYSTDTNITQVIESVAYYYDPATTHFDPTLHYIDEDGSGSGSSSGSSNNMLVLPVESTRYVTRPCVADTKFAYWQTDDYGSNLQFNASLYNATCLDEGTIVFDGFWIFRIDVDDDDSTSNKSATITKHFIIDHASSALRQQTAICTDTISLAVRSLAFNGDVMTFKRNVILSHDVLTQVEAAPALILTPTDCNT